MTTELGLASAFDIFLQIDPIPGESVDSKHVNEIEIESFSWGASNSSSLRRPGQSVAEDLRLLTPVSKASPELFRAAATGEHIKKAVLFVRKSGGGDDFYKVELEDILVTSIQSQSLNETAPEEEITLRFGKTPNRFGRSKMMDPWASR